MLMSREDWEAQDWDPFIMPTRFARAIGDILDERERQDMQLWGVEHDRTHSILEWADILVNEAVEASRNAYSVPGDIYHPPGDIEAARRGFIKTAAVALAALEHLEES